MKQKILLFVFLLLSTLTTSAYDAVIDGIYYNLYTETKQAEVTSGGDTKYFGSVTIPETIRYNDVTYDVTSIGAQAFDCCSGLTSIAIPKSMKEIGSWAFNSCWNLESVHITDLTAWCNIHFSSIASNPLYFGHHLYMDGEEIKDLIIPNSITEIGETVFAGCSGLTSLTIPAGVTYIGENAFCECHGLTEVTIPNSVLVIGGYAFGECHGLTNITIGNGVNSLENSAFIGCKKLTSVTIPASVTSIGGYAFGECNGLTDVYCYAVNVPLTNVQMFEYVNISDATLHVPAASVDAYKATEPWSRFGTIVASSDALRGDLNGDGKVGMPDLMFLLQKVHNGKFPDEK